jgi:hypothetical protein
VALPVARTSTLKSTEKGTDHTTRKLGASNLIEAKVALPAPLVYNPSFASARSLVVLSNPPVSPKPSLNPLFVPLTTLYCSQPRLAALA